MAGGATGTKVEGTMEGIFMVIFKKIVDLLGEPLKPLLLKRRDKFLEAMLDLHLRLKQLDSEITDLAEALDWVLEDIEHHSASYLTVTRSLRQIRTLLEAIRTDMEALAPGFVIYAEDIVSSIDQLTLIEDFYVNRAIPDDLVNWAAPFSKPEGERRKWQPILVEVRDTARETSKHIREFIRVNYTLETFKTLTS